MYRANILPEIVPSYMKLKNLFRHNIETPKPRKIKFFSVNLVEVTECKFFFVLRKPVWYEYYYTGSSLNFLEQHDNNEKWKCSGSGWRGP